MVFVGKEQKILNTMHCNVHISFLLSLFYFQSSQWNDCLLNLLANKDFEVILRGAVVVDNMVSSEKEVAEKVLATEVMEVLQAHIFRAKRK